MAVTTTPSTLAGEEADRVINAVMASAEGHADPYPHYHRLRGLAPVHRCGLDGVWYVSNFEACRDILGDPAIGKNDQFVVRRHGVSEARSGSPSAAPAPP